MKPIVYKKSNPSEPIGPIAHNIVRVEVPVESPTGMHTLMILDADDTVDLVVQHPDGEREIVWSLCKEPE